MPKLPPSPCATMADIKSWCTLRHVTSRKMTCFRLWFVASIFAICILERYCHRMWYSVFSFALNIQCHSHIPLRPWRIFNHILFLAKKYEFRMLFRSGLQLFLDNPPIRFSQPCGSRVPKISTAPQWPACFVLCSFKILDLLLYPALSRRLDSVSFRPLSHYSVIYGGFLGMLCWKL